MAIKLISDRTEHHTVNLTNEDILNLLRMRWPNVVIPTDAKVVFVVPDDGGVAGQTLDIDDKKPVIVQWSVNEWEKR